MSTSTRIVSDHQGPSSDQGIQDSGPDHALALRTQMHTGAGRQADRRTDGRTDRQKDRYK